MIKDPVTITSIGWRIFVEKNVQKLIFHFSANEKILSLQFVVSADYPISDVRKIFSICPSDKRKYTIGTRYANKEDFVDYLKENYPDHLDWLLFHQEWLC